MVDEFIYILPDHVGGVASVVYNLLKYSRSEYKKKVILLRTSEDGNIAFKFDCDEQIVIKIEKNQSLSSVYQNICNHISKSSVIVSNDGWYEIDALKYFGLDNPVVYILHGNFKHYYDQINKHRTRISKVIAVSSFLENAAKEYFDGDVNFVRFPIDGAYRIDTLKYISEPIIINYAGRLEDAKGSQFFPIVTSKLEQLGIPFIFNIFGTGDHEKSLSQKYAGKNNVRLYGQKPKDFVLQANVKAHILFLFSKTEGLPVCVVEGMKAGVVPIVFEIPSGINDIIINGQNGYIVPQGSTDEVVNKIKTLYYNRQMLKRMAFAALESSTRMFDPISQTKAYEDEYLTSKVKNGSFNFWKRCCLRLPAPSYYILVSYIKKIRNTLYLK